MSKLANIILVLFCGISATVITTWIIALITGKDSGGIIAMTVPIVLGLIVSLGVAIKVFKQRQ
jgi:hypothetical protein